MQLHAVIVPASGVVQDALDAARALLPQPSPPAADEPRRGLLDRLRGRRPAEAGPEPVVALAPAAPDEVFVRLAKFGNVTVTDADGLARAIVAVAGTWQAPALQVSRVGVAQAHPYDVTAQLDGDVDALRDIYRNVIEVAEQQRFYLDRRSFRSELALGSVEVEGGGPVPDSVAGVEAAHRGPRWTASHLTLLRTSFTDGRTTFAEVARIELADDAEELGARTGA